MISNRVSLLPSSAGGWIVTVDGEQQMHFESLNDAVEIILEFSLVVALENAAEAKQIEAGCVEVKDALEAFRQMIMAWFQAQVPDPHAVTDINRLN